MQHRPNRERRLVQDKLSSSVVADAISVSLWNVTDARAMASAARQIMLKYASVRSVLTLAAGP